MNDEVKQIILKTAADKKFSCINAHEISEKYKVSLREIGKFCNENGIKIIVCELGCF